MQLPPYKVNKLWFEASQSGLESEARCDATLKNGLELSSFDPCFYYKRIGSKMTFLAIYVDFLIFTNQLCNQLKVKFMRKFKMMFLAKAGSGHAGSSYLQGTIHLAQEQYIQDILSRLNMGGM